MRFWPNIIKTLEVRWKARVCMGRVRYFCSRGCKVIVLFGHTSVIGPRLVGITNRGYCRCAFAVGILRGLSSVEIGRSRVVISFSQFDSCGECGCLSSAMARGLQLAKPSLVRGGEIVRTQKDGLLYIFGWGAYLLAAWMLFLFTYSAAMLW